MGNGLICCSLRDGQHAWWHFKQSLAACELKAAVPWASSTMNCTQPSFNPAPPHLPQPYMASLLCMYFGKLCSSSLDFFFLVLFFPNHHKPPNSQTLTQVDMRPSLCCSQSVSPGRNHESSVLQGILTGNSGACGFTHFGEACRLYVSTPHTYVSKGQTLLCLTGLGSLRVKNIWREGPSFILTP